MDPHQTVACLKVDVDTHDGMRSGVPRLLDVFRSRGVKATFFLSFGPDNAGKAIWNVFRTKGFLGKMVRTGAPKLYGWRTILSGTLLPARMIAVKFPDLVRRIEQEGHEVGVHAWDHRLWQDHLERLGRERIHEQYEKAFRAFEAILGRPPAGAAAPAWFATAESLQVQDTLGLRYASDMRLGLPCFPRLGGHASSTLQIPTTQPCLEELWNQGCVDMDDCLSKVLAPPAAGTPRVIPLHAEVEGGAYGSFLEGLLERLAAQETEIVCLEEYARRILSALSPPPVIEAELREIPGRSGRVIAPASPGTRPPV